MSEVESLRAELKQALTERNALRDRRDALIELHKDAMRQYAELSAERDALADTVRKIRAALDTA